MFMLDIKRNLTTMTDFYELTMSAGYLEEGYQDKICVFDMFFRRVPDGGGFAIMAGLEQFIQAVDNLHFTQEDLEYLRSTGVFSELFLEYLKDFRLHCNIWAIREGVPIFPHEPIVTVEGPTIECQLLETLLLVTFNHQCLIATKANRIVRSASGRPVMEFGARRAQGYDAAYYGARASYIGGCGSTSCVMAARDFGIPASGTMAHSWVQMFPSEYEAFKKYAELYPNACMLLVDTYSVLKSGVPNAIRVFDEVLKPMGKRPLGIRIDSGDIAYLSKKARRMLDEAGYPDCTICASNSLDEYLVRDLISQGARVDSFGIGENMITAKSDPVFGGVYKLAAVKNEDGSYQPKIKISESSEKLTIPGLKKVWRIFDEDGKAMADYITLYDEEVSTEHGITLFDPVETWKERTYVNCTAQCISTPIYVEGKRVYECPSLQQVKAFCKEQLATLWDEVKRFENPHGYYVDLSQKLWDTRQELLRAISKEI
ncbi:nicotinate phosphoribosyltransferase [Fournierella massiliensis]|nr:nicotinate phosphoribosyltransferase [Fournierella massiliensis]MCF2557524.1 nicotinate phosphoribosyltransferase [Fournierella massiliensis]